MKKMHQSQTQSSNFIQKAKSQNVAAKLGSYVNSNYDVNAVLDDLSKKIDSDLVNN